jgi:tetratricopeptide (TPR) repeat protein
MAGLRLDGGSFFIVGRFDRLPKSRIERELAARDAKLSRRLNRKSDHAVITHAATGLLGSATLKTALALEPARCLSEDTFLRALGLAPVLHGRDIEAPRFLGLAGLAPDEVRLLALFDVLEPADGRYGFSDLKVAQHVTGLRQRGATLDAILTAATELRRRRRGAGAADVTRLDIAPSGDLMMRIGDVLAELDGQLRFAWEQSPPDPDAIFEAAESAAGTGDFETAERLYYACLSASPRDPVVRFNLANVLRELGRIAEAKVHYLAALEAEPGFAEAHFNLAHLAMAAGNLAEAIGHLERAVMVEPDYPDPLYNLAALYIQHDRIADATPLLERYLRLDAQSKWAHEARKLLLACRSVMAPGRAAHAPRRPVKPATD